MSAPTQHAHDLRPYAPASDTPVLTPYRGWVFEEDGPTRICIATKPGRAPLRAGSTPSVKKLIDEVEAAHAD